MLSCQKEESAEMKMTVKEKRSLDWHSLSQSQKDDEIMNTAFADYGLYVGIQCKPWVQRVVNTATSGHVTVPLTQSNQYQWYDDQSGHIVGRSTLIENVQRADIIQMYLYINGGWTPHTAIVVYKDSSGMMWIDSNWVATNTVGTHYVTYSQFYSWASNRYTVYHVQ